MSLPGPENVHTARYEQLRATRLVIAEERATWHIGRAVELELVWAPRLAPEKAAKALAFAADHRAKAERILRKADERHRKGGWD